MKPISRTLLISAALFAGTAIGCHHSTNGRNGMPSATGTATAQNNAGGDVGNGTDASGNGSTTPDPQQTQSPPCVNATDTGRSGNPNCDDGGTSHTNTNAEGNGPLGGQPTTPDPHP